MELLHNGFQNAPRVLVSVLAPLERRTLHWLARRLPAAVHSDHLTGLAAAAMVAAGLSFWLAQWDPRFLLGVVVALAVNWFGDSLDGTVARVRGHERPRYGFYVDHIVDALGTLVLLAGLGASGFMSPLVALGVLAAYYLVMLEVCMATYTLGRFQITYWNLGPTELRILLAFGALALWTHPSVTILGHRMLLFDVGGVVAIAGLTLTAVASAVRNGLALYQAEPRVRPSIPSAPRPAGRPV
jgi:phosphatidylglycerophosphate synthase